jgi:hypothetical protein
MIGAAGGTVQVTASIVCGVLAHGPCSGVVAELRLTDATGAVHTSRAVGHSVAAGSTSVQTFRFPVTGVAGAVVRYTGTVSFDTCGNDLTDNCIELPDTSPAATASAVA